MPTYGFPRPGLTVDIVVLRDRGEDRELLLIRRGIDPYKGRFALPGGFVEENERLEDAARRELAEETGLETGAPMRQVGAFGDPGRDPRGWTVSVAWLLELDGYDGRVEGGDDAGEAAWHRLDSLPPLAFDHELIVAAALEACR